VYRYYDIKIKNQIVTSSFEQDTKLNLQSTAHEKTNEFCEMILPHKTKISKNTAWNISAALSCQELVM